MTLASGGSMWPSGQRTFLPSLGGAGAPGSRGGRRPSHECAAAGTDSASCDGAVPLLEVETRWAVGTAGSGWSLASSARTWTPQVEARLRQAAGRELQALRPGDLQHSQQLKLQLQQLRLSDYFDNRGSPRFKRLGLSFAAKQHGEVGSAFGSRLLGDHGRGHGRGYFSARAVHRAAEAVERDARSAHSRTTELLEQLSNVDRHHVGDVRDRQLEMLFSEVPGFAEYVPANVQLVDLLPADVNKEEEFKERRMAERWNGYFHDRFWLEGAKMGWLLRREEILQINDALVLWSRAERGGNCPLGLDRPGFCRFLMDCQLIDQHKVPYFWAVSLFDSVAMPMHVCPPDATWAMTAPAAFMVNRWTVMTILDAVLRQHYDDKTSGAFSSKLTRAARHCLPVAPALGAKKESCVAPARFPLEHDEGVPGASRRPSESGSPLEDEPAAGPAAAQLSPSAAAGSRASANHHVPQWLQPPERPASSLDTRHEQQLRDRLVQSMLIEPEVLNMVMQHMEVFRKLHRCYADGDGHMDFQALVKFCTDFRLVPELVTSELLRTIYDAAQCLDWSVPAGATEDGSQKVLVITADAPRVIPATLQGARRSTRAERNAASRASVASRSSIGKNDAAQPEAENGSVESQPISVTGIFGSSAFAEALCKAAFVYLGFYGNIVQQSTSGYARVVWLVAYLRYAFVRLSKSLERRRSTGASIPEGPLTAALQAVSSDAWERPVCPEYPTTARVAQPMPGVGFRKVKKRKPHFRFIKLKPSSQTMSKFRASASAIIFTGRVQKKVSNGLSPFGEEEEEEEASSLGQTSVAEDSESSDEDLHEDRPEKPNSNSASEAPAPQLPASRATTASSGPHGDHLPHMSNEVRWMLEDLMRMEAGQPSIVRGVCTLCGHELAKFAWGNPRCRGCSIIDAISLDHHPFKHLLVEQTRDIRIARPKAQRLQGPRVREDLTPPPLDATAKESLRAHGPSEPRMHSARG